MNEHLKQFQQQLDLLIDYLVVEKGLADNTIQAYSRDITSYARYLFGQGCDSFSDATRKHLINYLKHLHREKRLKRSTVSRKLASIRSLHQFLVREELAEADPSANVDAPQPAKKLPDVLSVQQCAALLEAPNRDTPQGLRDAAMLTLTYAAGLRVSELVNLQMRDIDFHGESVRVTGKGDKERVIPIADSAVNLVQQYVQQARGAFTADPAETGLFLSNRGKTMSRVRFHQILKSYLPKAGLPPDTSAHTLRHSFATHMMQGDADMRAIQQLLGHANLSTTEIYTHVVNDRLSKIYEDKHPRSKQ